MKILISLLLLTLGVNANEVVYGSKSGITPESTKVVDVAAGEAIQILNSTFTGANILQIEVQHEKLPQVLWQTWRWDRNIGIYKTYADNRGVTTLPNNIMVGPCSIFVADNLNQEFAWQVSYKLTKPSAAGTTTSAPILLPPTQDAAKSWFVKLQVSSDLKAWDDVAPGQFLGSDTARFFRIQTSEQ